MLPSGNARTRVLAEEGVDGHENKLCLDEKCFEKFQKQFKSDYYLGKLVFQQHYFERDKLINLLTKCTEMAADFQLRNSHEEHSIHQFVFSTCKK